MDQRLDRSQKTVALSLRTDPLGLNSEDLGYLNQIFFTLTVLYSLTCCCKTLNIYTSFMHNMFCCKCCCDIYIINSEIKPRLGCNWLKCLSKAVLTPLMKTLFLHGFCWNDTKTPPLTSLR